MSNYQSPLSDEEQEQLVVLLGRMVWPLQPRVFHALVNKTVTVAIELVVFNSEGKVLLECRKDIEYDGYALPGTVLRDNEDIPTATKRLFEKEIRSQVSEPVSLGWMEIQKGTELGQDLYRHYIALLYSSKLEGPYLGGGEFFQVNQIPKNTLSHEKSIVEEVVKRITDSNQQILIST